MSPRKESASAPCLVGRHLPSGERRLRVRTKRIYEPPARGDGFRVLVDRLWPRGVSREAAHLNAWAKELAPSANLRRWFGHVPRKWSEFGRRYRRELQQARTELDGLRHIASRRTVTLLYAAKDPAHNHALVLKAVLEAE